jgi:enoyl-CoA hydratase
MHHTITLDGPGKNALGTPLLRQLQAELVAAGAAPLLLRGANGVFSAGLDLGEVLHLDGPRMATFLDLLEDVVCRLFDHPAPTVAAIGGHAIAGGSVLALCCDHIVSTTDPKAKIGLNEVALGLRFPPRILRVVRDRLPHTTTAEVILGAGLHDPTNALRLGLVDALAEDPEQAALVRLNHLSALPRAAWAATKMTLRAEITTPRPGERASFLENVVPAWTSPEVAERVAKILRRPAPPRL